MPIKMTVTFAISLLVLGASYAFADGMLNDADKTKALGGVGNYLFWDQKNNSSAKNELVNSGNAYERDATFHDSDVLSIRQSSAIQPSRSVTFPFGSAHLQDAEANRLDAIAAELKADPALKAQVTGYADNLGESSTNKALSQARAKNVVRGLQARGVSDSQLSWNAKGEANPVSDNSTREGRALNRRVDIQFQ